MLRHKRRRADQLKDDDTEQRSTCDPLVSQAETF